MIEKENGNDENMKRWCEVGNCVYKNLISFGIYFGWIINSILISRDSYKLSLPALHCVFITFTPPYPLRSCCLSCKWTLCLPVYSQNLVKWPKKICGTCVGWKYIKNLFLTCDKQKSCEINWTDESLRR